MARIHAFVDGFNVYHALMQEDSRGRQPYARYRWLDYWRLAECFLAEGDVLAATHYFTAYVPWKTGNGPDKKARHQALVRAQRARGVRVVLGRFRPVTKTCMGACKQTYRTYEEKRTDVNIAVAMLEGAVRGEYEEAILISGDSDLVPAVEAVKRIRPGVRVAVVAPVERKAAALWNVADRKLHMKRSHLNKSLLPAEVDLGGGRSVICPPEWL